MKYLSDYCIGRDNNFLLLRFIAATMVLVTHSFALSIGTGDAEPLRASLGITLGSVAVDIFFVTSGFLVTQSLLLRKDLPQFIAARVLRIYPALLVVVVLSVFLLGLLVTALPIAEYFGSLETWKYLLKNSTLVAGVAYYLPRVFEAIPYERAVNGSLWTLPYEIQMYGLLAGSWFLLSCWKNSRQRGFTLLLVAVAVIGMISHVALHLTGNSNLFIGLLAMFFSGGTFYVFRDRILLSSRVFALLASAVLISVLNRELFFVVYTLAMPYLVLFLAYAPGGFLRKFNRLGDYSYGIYIYAFPLQQTIALLWPGVNVLQMVLASFVATCAFAIASWHIVEKRALSLKDGSLFSNAELLGVQSKAAVRYE